MDEVHVVDSNAQYSSLHAIFEVALPACILNAAAPLTAVVQTGLLGRYVGTSALGAFGAVTITAGFATRVFNFLVDGVSAKTGKCVGARAWGELGGRVRMALGFALGAGALASVTLAAVIQPVSVHILHLEPDVQADARLYWRLRVALVPVLLLNMALSGTLQGFRRVRVSAAINTAQAVLEMAGSAVVLRGGAFAGPAQGLFAMGCVTLITQLMALVAGLSCILFLPPLEAEGQFSLVDEWFGPAAARLKAWQRGGTASSDSDGEDLQRPLLVQHDSVASLHTLSKHINVKINGGSSGECSPQSGSSSGAAIPSPPASPAAVVSVAGLASNDTEAPLEGGPAAAAAAAVGDATQPPAGGRDSSSGGGRDEALLDFVKDGFNMLVRSLILQVTFFVSLVAASRLGTATLAAHSVVSQLWILISYAVDGFAAAGIVLGSRLAAQAHDPLRAADAKRHLLLLIRRVLWAGLIAGVAAGAVFAAGRRSVVALFTDDPAAAEVLSGATWLVLCLAQPINGLVFVFDGLMYASQSFRFIRNYMLAGFLLVFCPMLAVEALYVQQLWSVWAANAAINTWRAAGAAYLIFVIFLKEFDALGSRAQLAPQEDV